MDPSAACRQAWGTLTVSPSPSLQGHHSWWLEPCFFSAPSEAGPAPFPSGCGTECNVLWPTACQGLPAPIGHGFDGGLCLALVELKCVSLSPFLCFCSWRRGGSLPFYCMTARLSSSCGSEASVVPDPRMWSRLFLTGLSRGSSSKCPWTPTGRACMWLVTARLLQPGVGATSWLTSSFCSGKFSWYVLMMSHPSLFFLKPWVLRMYSSEACLWLSLLLISHLSVLWYVFWRTPLILASNFSMTLSLALIFYISFLFSTCS